jgi:protoporphyrinogen oxidase
MSHTLVLGGGIAGLTLASELGARGEQVTVLERAGVFGGLARTFARDGFRFDIGGHRFHSSNPAVVAWIRDLLGPDLLTVPRCSHIYMGGRFVEYPLRFPGALRIFRPLQAARLAGSYLAARFARNGHPERSFEDWVVRRFGRGRYDIYFKPYTEKVWGIPCAELSAEWASRRISLPSLTAAVRDALRPARERPATAITQFYYPRSGYGLIGDTLAANAARSGARLLANAELRELRPFGEAAGSGFQALVRIGDSTRPLVADRVISTIPLGALLAAIPPELGSETVARDAALRYRDLICLFVAANKEQISRDTWTYFPGAEIIFGRTHEPKNWSSEMVPSPEVSSMAFEIFAGAGEAVWELSDDQLLERVLQVTARLGWLQRGEVSRYWVLRVRNAYPVYDLDYAPRLAAVRDYLARWPDLHLVGRTGSFRYMNVDGVVEDCFALLAQLTGERGRVAALVDETARWA